MACWKHDVLSVVGIELRERRTCTENDCRHTGLTGIKEIKNTQDSFKRDESITTVSAGLKQTVAI